MNKKIVWIIFLCLGTCFSGCQTYYFANVEFNNAFKAGNFEFCQNWLEKHKPGKRNKAKFLYNANKGMVSFIINDQESSNKALEDAFLLAEDYQKNAGENVASFLTNPKRITYKGERHEILLLSYFKAMNHWKNNDLESALIEARRLIRKLNVLQDEGKKDKYNSDGFMLWMVACLFEASGDFNNAYIYYKKAFDSYHSGFGRMAGIATPRQLKLDVIRSAYLSGFDLEAQNLESRTGLKNEPLDTENGIALLIWHKGLGPVKDENRITFQVLKGAGGAISFSNQEMGVSFPFYFPPNQASSPVRFDDLKIITMALPKYVNRNWGLKELSAKYQGARLDFEPATNIETIAATDLADRNGKELALGISRVAIKQALQYAATKGTEAAVENGKDTKKSQQQAALAGSLVNLAFTIANTATEVADTRNWQTLPAGIELLRVSLPPGKQTIQLEGKGRTPFSKNLEIEIKKGQTMVHTIHTF